MPLWRVLGDVVQDVRYASRALRRRRGLALAAILTFAAGVGASTAIFSVVYGVLLREFPYRDVDQLMILQGRDRQTGKIMSGGYSNLDVQDWQAMVPSVESLAFCSRDIFALDADAGFETVSGSYVSSGFFATLGIQPTLGRWPRGGAEELAISDRLWRGRFAADPRVIGRAVRLNSTAFTIVGVASPQLEFPPEGRLSLSAPPKPPALWAPVEFSPFAAKRAIHYGQLVGRLARGRTFGEAAAEVARASRQFARQQPPWAEVYEAAVVPLEAELTGDVRPALWTLLGAVACVWLVGCANVANLLLARQASRGREIALRVALGAPRRRLVSYALVEALLLALAGGVAGICLAAWGVAVLRWLDPADLPRLESVRVDVPVLLFAVGLSAAAALTAGAGPVWQLLVRGPDPGAVGVKQDPASGPAVRRLRSALVVAELTVSLVLLVGAGLLGRSFLSLVGTNAGMVPEQVVSIELNLAMGRTLSRSRQIDLTDRLVAAARALPGVTSAAAAIGLPPARGRGRYDFEMRDPRTGGSVPVSLNLMNPTPEYFRTLGIPLLRGRLFNPLDGADTQEVAILSASAARRLFGTLEVEGRPLQVSPKTSLAIVGVVGDVRFRGLEEPADDTLYLPFTQYPFRNMTLVAKTARDPRLVLAALPGAVHGVDRDITIGPARTLDDVVSETVARPRFRTLLLGALAGLGLLLAAVGLYGVTVYTVAQRTTEIGVRMALGAGQRQVVSMIVGECLQLAAIGTVLGIAVAVGVSKALSQFLFGVTPRDVASYAAASLGLALVSVAAGWVAARRAARVDPLVALRAE